MTTRFDQIHDQMETEWNALSEEAMATGDSVAMLDKKLKLFQRHLMTLSQLGAKDKTNSAGEPLGVNLCPEIDAKYFRRERNHD